MNTLITTNPSIAADIISEGGVVIFPTETVYGIGASSRIHGACRKIYAIKNRPMDNPLIVHVAGFSAMDEIAVISDEYREIVQTINGPVTYIFTKKDPGIFSGGLDTIAVRIPLLELTRKFLAKAGPVSAPSANLSGKPSVTSHDDAVRIFSGKVDAILEGPDAGIGLESAIIDLTGERPVYLRPGSFSYAEALNYFSTIIQYDSSIHIRPVTPGMKYRHYAPEGRVILFGDIREVKQSANSAMIGFQSLSGISHQTLVKNNTEYMHELFRFFNFCDREGVTTIYCQLPEDDMFRPALLNRIEKAMK